MNLAKIGHKNPNFGKVHSAEAKAKISIARRTAIFVYSENNILVNNFPSANNAGEFFNTHSKTILKYSQMVRYLKKSGFYLHLKNRYMVGIIYHYYKLVKLLFDNLTPPYFY